MRFSTATLIVNPLAGGGRARRALPRIRQELKNRIPRTDFLLTRGKEDALRLARQAVIKGSELLIAVGGDGTVNQIVNGLFQTRKNSAPDCALAIIPAGASCSLARELGIPRGRTSLKLAAKGRARPIDLLLLKWTTPSGQRKERLALTMSNFGFAGAVVKSLQPRMQKLGAFLAFGLTAALQLFRYTTTRMIVESEGNEIARSRILSVIVANTQWEGGGMRPAPQATPDDGTLDLIVIEDMPLLSRLRHFPKIYTGNHVSLPMVKCARASKVLIRPERILPFEFDGEWAECRECSVEVMPNALTVLVPEERGGSTANPPLCTA